MVRRTAVVITLALEALISGCAVPTTQLGTVSPDDIRSEQLKQQELAIEWDLRQQQRVEDVGHTLLVAAAPFRSVPAPSVTVRRGRLPYESDSVASTVSASTSSRGPDDRRRRRQISGVGWLRENAHYHQLLTEAPKRR